MKETTYQGIRLTFYVALMLAAVFGARLMVADAAPKSSPSDLRVSLACSPLTSSQSAKPGDPQTCRIRVQNYGATAITGITVSHPTSSTLVSTTYAGAFDLAPRSGIIFFEQLTFNATQDGRGKTTATATGTQAGEILVAAGTEQKSLP